MIEFQISNLRADPTFPIDRITFAANVESDFAVFADGRLVYEESDFPVVELAVAFHLWQQNRVDSEPDFEFDSMSFEELGMVWIRWAGDGWRVGSLNQERPEMAVFSSEDIDAAIYRFNKELEKEVLESFGETWVREFRTLLANAV